MIVWAAFLSVACIFIWLGFIEWPGLHPDANLYATPIINVASGKGWVFGAYSPLLVIRDSTEYAFHGILHVLVYGVVLNAGTWDEYSAWCGLVNALVWYARLHYRALKLVDQA